MQHLQSLRLFILSFLICVLFGSAFAARPWTPNDDISNGIPVNGAVQIHSETLGLGHLRIHISEPKVQMEQVELNKQIWTLVTIDGETRLWQNGKPALPLISRFIRFPNKGNVDLIVTPGEFDEYHDIDVLPQQPTDLKINGKKLDPADYTYESEIYSQNKWYPSDIAGFTTPQVLRDARVALLGVQPVQYNPVTRTLRVYKTIDIETVPNGDIGENELLDTRSHAVPSFAGIYSQIIGADDLELDAQNAAPGQILIICRSGVSTIAQQLADWKTQSGHPTTVITTALTSAQSIHDNLIMPVYNSGTPPLETVLLVGDGGTTTANYEMPAFTWSWTGPYAETIYSDHYYGCINTSTNFNSGILASWWSGRFSATTDQQFQTMVNRTLNYERTPYFGPTGSDTAWYNYAWGYAGTGNNIYTNPACIRYCLQCIRDRGVTNLLYDEHSGSVDQNLITSRLSGGALFWPHRASWVNEITNANVDGVTNSNKPWVGCNVSCYTGEWYGSASTGIQEEVTRLGIPTAPKGALSSVSTQTDGTNPAHNNVTAAGTFYALTLNARQPGPMYFQAKYQLYRNFGYGESASPTPVEMFILANNPHGDLSVNFWTGVPHALTVNVPSTLGIGQNRMALQVLRASVPVVGALVTAWKKNAGGTNETYTRGITDSNGNVVLTLSNSSAGNMLLTVVGNQVGQNYIPVLDTVVIAQTATDLAYNSQSILDDNTGGRTGNSNGTANPGETLDLSVSLINRGTSTASGITGTLVSTDSRVVITNSNQNWNNIAAAGTVQSNSPFRVQLLGGFIDNELVPLRLDLTTAQGSRSITVPLTVRTTKLNYVSYNTSTTWNPGGSVGLYITVQNNGGLGIVTPTTATLTSLTSGVSVTSTQAQFNTLPVGSNVTNSTSQWTVSSSALVVPGTQASFRAVFVNGSVSDTVIFTAACGTVTSTCPTGPDPYGYYAYDNTDVSYANVPTYSWVEIIPANGGSGTRLAITDNTTQDAAAVVHLPFTARYYGVNYDSVTICDNGWIAFGGQRSPDAGHVPFNFSRNWHLPTHEGPKNLVAVNWCDQTNTGTNEGSYYYYDAINHRYIVTWKTTTVYTPAAQEYQCIIYDPAYYPTATADAQFKFQYKTFTPAIYSGGETGVSYATVGIADSTYTRAIEYCYWNVYTPGSASIPTGTPSSNQRAILFTTTQTDSLLHIILPIAGDSLAIGSTANIQWRGRPALSTVNIDINRSYSGGAWERILSGVTNNGSTNWLVTGPASTTARLRVMSIAGTEGDTLHGNIIVSLPRIVVSSPNGGESWSGTTSHNITWTSSLVTSTVSIQIDRNYPSGIWENLFTNIQNSGSQAWVQSPPSTTTARIRVMSNTIPTAGDTSNANFTISAPAMMVLNPATLFRNVVPGDTVRQTVSLNNTGNSALTAGSLLNSTYLGSQLNLVSPNPTYSWIDASAGVGGPTGDDATTTYILPFSFPYYGTNYTQISVCTNGWISFGSTSVNDWSNSALPDANLSTMLAVYWDDLTASTGQIKILMDGANNRAVVAFNDVTLTGSYQVNAEAVLYSDGRIYFEYGTMSSSLNSGTRGVQNGSTVIQISNGTTVTSNTAYLFQRSNPFTVPSQTSFAIPANSNTNFSLLWDARGHVNGDSVSGSWIFSGDAANSPYTVPVSMKVYSSPIAGVSQSATNIANSGNFVFDSTIIQHSDTAVFTLTNTGGVALNLTGIPRVASTGNFTVISQPSTPIASYSSSTFTVRFTPSTAGLRTGTLTIPNNDPLRNPYTINLSGYGYTTVPVISVHRGTVNIPINTGYTTFDTTQLATPVDEDFKIFNTGSSVLHFTGTPYVNSTGNFSVVAQPASSVATGDSTIFTVRFTPAVVGADTGVVTIASDDTLHNPFTFHVVGFTKEPVMELRNGTTTLPNNLTTLAYDTIEYVGYEDIILTVRNIGTDTLHLSGTPTVATTGDFIVTAQPASVIAPGGTSDFSVRYSPTVLSAASGNLTIANDDPFHNPYVINLTGYALDPFMRVSLGADSIANNNATVVLDTTFIGITKSATFTITNYGNYDLSLTSLPTVQVVGDFSITSTADADIAPGANSNFTIHCLRATPGLAIGTVIIESDDPFNNTFTFHLNCYFTQPPTAPTNLQVGIVGGHAALTWSPSTGAVSGYSVYSDTTGYFIPDTLTYHNRSITLPVGTINWTDPASPVVRYYKVSAFSTYAMGSSSSLGDLRHARIVTTQSTDSGQNVVSASRVRKGHIGIGRVIIRGNNSGEASTTRLLPKSAGNVSMGSMTKSGLQQKK